MSAVGGPGLELERGHNISNNQHHCKDRVCDVIYNEGQREATQASLSFCVVKETV